MVIARVIWPRLAPMRLSIRSCSRRRAPAATVVLISETVEYAMSAVMNMELTQAPVCCSAVPGPLPPPLRLEWTVLLNVPS